MSTSVTKYDEKLAAMAQQYTDVEHVGGDFLSTKGGILQFQGTPLDGNQMCVIILDAVTERTFYTSKYDGTSEHNLPPVCYAFGRTAQDVADMGPHPSMQADLSYFQPQNDVCATCPNNAWGSADTGKGKACKERRRMAILPAGFYTPRRGSRDFDLEIITDPQHYKEADIAYLKLPVMSVKDWARYVTTLGSTLRRPPAGVITRVYIEPDPKSQYRVKFEMLEEVPDDLMEVILDRHAEAESNIVFGYPAPSGEAAEGAAPRRGLRR